MKRYVTVEEIRHLIKNEVKGKYTLTYWNLHSDLGPEIFHGNCIELDEYSNIHDDEIYCNLDTDRDGNGTFPIEFKWDRGEIHRFENDHYQFSLQVEYD